MKSKKNERVKVNRLLLYFVISLPIFLYSAWLFSWTQIVLGNWTELQISNSPSVNVKDKLNASLEIVKAIAGGAGTLAAVAGGFVLYLNFRVANRNAEIANRNAEIANRNARNTELRLITERFSKAIEQLGSEKLEVCLGGIYSLEKIAMESIEYHWTIMEVLTAFVRGISVTDLSRNSTRNSSTYKIAIQTSLTVIGRRIAERDPTERKLDLSHSNLNGFTIIGSFSGADFSDAELQGANLSDDFTNADFKNADLQESKLSRCNLTNAIFTYANLNNAEIIDSELKSAKLNKCFLYDANFRKAELQGANLNDSHIRGVLFEATLENCSFLNTIFWDFEKWEHRHETEDEEYIRRTEENMGMKYNDYEDNDNDETTYWQPDFRLANGLNAKQIKASKDWTKAIYDEDIRQLLGLPKYEEDETRDLSEILKDEGE